MRILFAGHSLATPLGGGELSARTLLEALAVRHRVEALCAGRQERSYELAHGVRCRDAAVRPPLPGLPLHLGLLMTESRFRPVLNRHLREQPPTLLILQQPAAPEPINVSDSTRVVVFLRSLACYGVGDPTPTRWKRSVGRVFREMHRHRTQALVRRADLVVTNSRFLQRAVEQHTGLRSEVLPPFMATRSPTPATAPGPHEHLTFVGLDAWKGAVMAIRLAEALPDRRFLFLEGSRPSPDLVARARRLPNVTCEAWTTDMRPVFGRTRVLLMPSLWDEPFGRLPVEAGAQGVPTIASARGGLGESVGAGGLLVAQPDDVSAWTGAIRDLDDPARYDAVSAAARVHAHGLDLARTMTRFVDLVRGTTGLELGAAQ